MSVNERKPFAELIDENSEDEVDPGSRENEDSSFIILSRLIEAVRDGLSKTSSLLKELTDVNDLDIKATDNFQRNAFHYAVSEPDTLRVLLEKLTEIKPSVDDALKQRDHEGEVPIHHAAIGANIESLEILYNYDPSLMKLETRKKKSVLHLAVMSRSAVAVKFVLSKDVDLINCKDNMLKTPVHEAANLKQVSILELLISRGSSTMLEDANGQLPIHIAANKGLRNTVEVLLRKDPDALNKIDNSGQTPILLAAKNGFPQLVSYLLDKKANCGLQDKCTPKRTAFDWAVKLKHVAVVNVFLERFKLRELKQVKKYSAKDGPEECLTAMIKREPDMARLLLDKCVTGDKRSKITYDFFCLESKDKESNCPQFKALQTMIDTESEICLCHPVVKKYVDIKWRNRGLKYTVILILTKLLFHISLMVYTTRVIGMVTSGSEKRNDGSGNVAITRESTPPNATEMVVLRVIIVVIAVGDILRELVKVITQRCRYFADIGRYYKIVMLFSVMFYMFPVGDRLTVKQIAYGAVAVFWSWLNLMQVLKLIPVLGVYFILVEKVFWSVAKIFLVVVIYLLSFASTFYILLAEHYHFRNIYISFVSTFVSMMNGFDYDSLFVAYGWHPGLYELKMVFLFLFMLIMCIVVNNALIGLAVGDANDVMKSAKFDKFRRRAEFIIRLEKAMNKIPIFKSAAVLHHSEPRKGEKSFFQKISDFFLSSQIDDGDVVDGSNAKNRSQLEMEEDNVDKAIEVKLENVYTKLQLELSGIRDQLKNLERY